MTRHRYEPDAHQQAAAWRQVMGPTPEPPDPSEVERVAMALDVVVTGDPASFLEVARVNHPELFEARAYDRPPDPAAVARRALVRERAEVQRRLVEINKKLGA